MDSRAVIGVGNFLICLVAKSRGGVLNALMKMGVRSADSL